MLQQMNEYAQILHQFLSEALSLFCQEEIISLEISRKKLREKILKRIKHVQTCVLAREICFLVRTNRAVLDLKDVHAFCLDVSKLCKDAGCEEPGEVCRQAAEAVGLGNEVKYLELCAQSCTKCGKARRPPPTKIPYVA